MVSSPDCQSPDFHSMRRCFPNVRNEASPAGVLQTSPHPRHGSSVRSREGLNGCLLGTKGQDFSESFNLMNRVKTGKGNSFNGST